MGSALDLLIHPRPNPQSTTTRLRNLGSGAVNFCFETGLSSISILLQSRQVQIVISVILVVGVEREYGMIWYGMG